MQLIQGKSTHTGNRVYTDESGFKYPSVSTLAGFFFSTYGLNAWRKKVGYAEANRIGRESAARGTRLHSAIEHNEWTGDEELDRYLTHYHNDIAPHLEVLHQELILGHVTPEGYRFAGTCDLIARWKGELVIADWKTSEKIKNKNFMGRFALQLSAYSIAHGEDTDLGMIFNLAPDQAAVFHIPLQPAKEMLLDTLLPSFYDYYRLPECDRPYPNQFRNLGAILSSFEKDLAKSIVIE
jgi:hypothetical protein